MLRIISNIFQKRLIHSILKMIEKTESLAQVAAQKHAVKYKLGSIR